ncbi:hypothetical protein KJ966_12415 [bacterium]|nr:hypothetical protein [bacterium]
MAKSLSDRFEGGYISHNPMFRNLTADEVKEFQEHARQNYTPDSPINDVWHPVYRSECMKINSECQAKQKKVMP